MTRINICGFETGDFSECYESVGDASITTDAKRSGEYGLKLNHISGVVKIAGFDIYGVAVPFDMPTVYYRFYWKKYSGTVECEIMQAATPVYALKFSMLVNFSTGAVTAEDSMSTALSVSGTVSLTDWNLFEVKVGTGASAAWEIKLNGSSIGSGTANLAAANNGFLSLGPWGVTGEVFSYYDDIAIDISAFPSPSAIIRLDPDGTHSTSGTWTGSNTDVDDYNSQAGDDGDTTTLSTNGGTGSYYYCTFEDMPVSPQSVSTVKLLGRTRDANQTNSYFYTGATGLELQPLDNPAGTAYQTRCILSEFKTTESDVNGIYWGLNKYQSQARYLYNTVLALMVEYVPATAGPSNLKTVEGLAKANVKTVHGLALGSVKTVHGLA